MSDEITKLQDWYAAQCEEVAEQAIQGPDGVYHFLTFRAGRCYEELEETRERTPWQHRYGVVIASTCVESLGWQVAIDLVGTTLDGATMPMFERRARQGDWIRCEISGGHFRGAGDPSKLTAILNQFFQLCNQDSYNTSVQDAVQFTAEDLRMLDEQYVGWRRQVALTTVSGHDGVMHQLVFRSGRYEEVGEAHPTPRQEAPDNLRRLQDWYVAQCQRIEQAGYRGSSDRRALIEIGTTDNPAWSVTIDLNGTKLEEAVMPKVEIDNGDYDWLTCSINDRLFSAVGDQYKLTVILDTFFHLTPKT